MQSGEVDVIAAPEIEITDGAESGPITFDAVVEVRPTVNVAGYQNLRVEIPALAPTDDDVDQSIERMRSQYADLIVVERAAADGDYVTINIEASRDGEAIPGYTANGFAYELGAGGAVPQIDENLRGASAGDQLEFTGDDHTHDHDHDGDEERDFYQIQNDVLSTTETEFLEEYRQEGLSVEVHRLQPRRLSDILESVQAPADFDLLTIDTEEHDLQVLKSLDFNVYHPRVVMVEDESFDPLAPEENKIYHYLNGFGYRLEGYVLKNLYFMRTDRLPKPQ